MRHGKFALPVLLVAIFSSCGKSPQGSQETGTQAATVAPAAPVRARPVPTGAGETKKLFDRIASKEVGDAVGRVEMRDAGLLLHPGETKPTVVTFRLGGELKSIDLRMFVADLPPEVQASNEVGTVKVEILLDGKSAFSGSFDKWTDLDRSVDVSGAQVLTVKVDNGEGKSWYDWFFLHVVRLS